MKITLANDAHCAYNAAIPRKIRELERDLLKAGFTWKAGKGSHRRYIHECGAKITISGQAGADAKRYQEDVVAEAIEKAKAWMR